MRLICRLLQKCDAREGPTGSKTAEKDAPKAAKWCAALILQGKWLAEAALIRAAGRSNHSVKQASKAQNEQDEVSIRRSGAQLAFREQGE